MQPPSLSPPPGARPNGSCLSLPYGHAPDHYGELPLGTAR